MHEKNEHPVADAYPVGYPLLLECENDTAMAYQEMVKLTYYRAPLKVLVCYDYGSKSRWGYAKERLIKNFHEIIHQTNEWFPENPQTEYLLIIGTVQPTQWLLWSYMMYSFPEGSVVMKQVA